MNKHLMIRLALTTHADITNESILSEIRSHLESVPAFYESTITLDTFTAPVYYMILDEHEDETRYWSNELGWVTDQTLGTKFDTNQHYSLPRALFSAGRLTGYWVRFSGDQA